jgi:membrane-associated phospholipid phosphatase
LAVAGAASRGVSAWDGSLTESFRDSARLDEFFRFGDTAGGARVQIGFALAAYSAGRVLREPGVTGLGRDLIRVQVLNGVATQALKWSVRRERPNGSSRLSFPSGHASASFATATVLGRRYGWRVGVPAYALAVYVAGSRVQDNKHFHSDVVFGSALGIAAGRSVTVNGRGRSLSVGPGWFPQGPGLAISIRLGRF